MRRAAGSAAGLALLSSKRRRLEPTDTDLIEFALANIALEDKFAEKFKAARGKVDPDLKLGF